MLCNIGISFAGLESSVHLFLIYMSVGFVNCYFLVVIGLCSEGDRAHIRLAAAKSVLQLSRRWDLHISPEIFCSTLFMAKVCWPQKILKTENIVFKGFLINSECINS